MAYDHDLADRIRELVAMEPSLTEKAMFGGLAFLVNGHMAVSASGQGGLLVRVDPADSDRLLASTPAEPMEMGGRSMNGWLRVAPEHLVNKRDLNEWVSIALAYVHTLEPKKPTKAKKRTG